MAPRASEPEPLGHPHPILCAVLDAAALGPEPQARARMLFAAGVDWIQLRDRRLEAGPLWQIACDLVRAADQANAARSARRPERHRVIVNRRLDIAWAAGADGVHLGFDALAPDVARDLLGADRLIGVSLHDPVEIARVGREPDYAHLAPIWDPRSKPSSRPPLGLAALAEACHGGPPILAQGGLDPDRAARAVAAGAAGIAVSGALAEPAKSESAARALREALDASRESHPLS